MATIKSFTSLEQSCKLAEFLSIESADLYYYKYGLPHFIEGQRDYESIKTDKYHDYIPCWSLAALLGVIPKPDLIQNSEEIWLVHSWVYAYPWSVGGYSNPIDACVAMIEKLHELNLL